MKWAPFYYSHYGILIFFITTILFFAFYSVYAHLDLLSPEMAAENARQFWESTLNPEQIDNTEDSDE